MRIVVANCVESGAPKAGSSDGVWAPIEWEDACEWEREASSPEAKSDEVAARTARTCQDPRSLRMLKPGLR